MGKLDEDKKVNGETMTPADAGNGTGEPQTPPEAENKGKKGKLRSLGTAAWIGLGVLATAVVTGGLWVVSHLLGGKDEDDPTEEATEETENNSDEPAEE